MAESEMKPRWIAPSLRVADSAPRNDINSLRPRWDRFGMRNDSFLRRNELNDVEAAMRNRSFRYVTRTRLGGGPALCGGGERSSGLAPVPDRGPVCEWRCAEAQLSR